MKLHVPRSGKTPVKFMVLICELLKKLTLEQLAARTNISKSALSRYSKGIGMPSFDTLQKLADYSDQKFIVEIVPYYKEQ